MHKHFTPHTAATAISLRTDKELSRRMGSCPTCLRAVVILGRWARIADHPEPLVIAEIDMGKRRLDKLQSLPLEEARRLIASDEELHRWGLARLALVSAQKKLDRAKKWGTEPTQDASRLALLAVDVATHLDSELYGQDHCRRLHHEAVETYLRAQHARAIPEDPDQAFERVLEQFQAVFSLQLRHLKT